LEKYLPENLSEDASVIALKIKSKKKKMIVKNRAELSKPVLHISLSLASEENFQKPH